VVAFVDHLRVERRLAARTLAMYTLALQRLAAFAAADGVALESAQPLHFRHWLARLRLEHPGADGETGLGPRSLAIALAAWRGLYRFWGREGIVQADPLAGLRPPKAPRRLPKALNVEQAVALVERGNAVADEAPAGSPAAQALAARDRLVAELLYGGGLRIGELLGLDVRASAGAAGWIDLDPDGGATAHVLGKGSKRRSVPLGAPAVAALRGWLALRGGLLSPAAAGEAALLVSRLGRRLSQSSGDLRAVQELLGHASIASTQVYTKLDFQHLARAYDQAHPRAKRAK
jgi:integrase/recombinase XerC